MKVLITGSSGLLARMLIKYLTDNEDYVVGIDIRENQEIYDNEKFRFYKCSITEKEKMKSIFDSEQPDHVVHFASSFNKVRNRKREIEIDIEGSDNVLESANDTLSVRQLIYSSSAAAYGGRRDNPLWIKESYPLRPESYRYGMNKKMVERNYTRADVRDDLNVVILRICTVVGPIYDKPRSVLSILLKLKYMPAFTRDTLIQLIHTEDMVALFGFIMNDREIKGIFNFAGDTYSAVKEITQDKHFIYIPVYFMKSVLWVLWHLRILNLHPAAISNSYYPLILDPAKLVSRYGYTFKFTSDEAYRDVAESNRLPEGTRF